MADNLRDVLTHGEVVVIGKAIPELSTWDPAAGTSAVTLDVARTLKRPALASTA